MKKKSTLFLRHMLLCAVCAGVSLQANAAKTYYYNVQALVNEVGGTNEGNTAYVSPGANSEGYYSGGNSSQDFTFSSTCVADYVFVGWTGSAIDDLSNTTTFVSTDDTFSVTVQGQNNKSKADQNKVERYANFFFVKIESDYTGTVSRAYNRGDKKITLTATMPTDNTHAYKFLGWKFKSATATEYSSVYVSTDKTYTFDLTNNSAGSYKAFYAVSDELQGWTLDNNTLTATFSGDDLVVVPQVNGENIKVNNVVLSRTFIEGVASTVMLPFGADVNGFTCGKFYTFDGVTYDQAAEKWIADMTQVTTLVANTPYVFMPEASEMSFNFTNGVLLSTEADSYSTTNGDWTFTGTYSNLVYGTDLSGKVFGFAGAAQAADAGVDAVEAGEFVRAGNNANIPAMRNYLTYNGTDEALQGPRRAAAMPDRIVVRLHNVDDHVTAIDQMENVRFNNNAFYTLDGRLVNGQPVQKGIYIMSGKKVIIK